MQSRRELLQTLLAAVPATVVGRGFANSGRVNKILSKYTKIRWALKNIKPALVTEGGYFPVPASFPKYLTDTGNVEG